MGIMYRGVLRTFVRDDKTTAHLDAIREVLEEQLGYPVFTPLTAGKDYIDIPIEHELVGTNPMPELLNKLSTTDGCAGAMWIDCDSLLGHYSFVSCASMSVQEYNHRIEEFITEVRINLTRTLNHSLEHHEVVT